MYSEELAILKTAITNEHEGRQFYLMAAEKIPAGDVKNIFLALADDETRHEEWLRGIYSSLLQRKKPTVGTLPLQEHAHSPNVFRKEYLKNIGSLEVSALHVGVLMEMASADYYRTAAAHTEIQAIRELYLSLADWETEHLRKLEEAYDFAKEDWWARQRFSPA